ncbi:MAG: agmatinase [Kiritimatiellia bacterium]|nr:agmatinase [Lentisphaerota bacterium]
MQERARLMEYFFENGAAYCENTAAPCVVLPAPYEATVSFGRGTALAPDAILNASRQLELFDEELCRPVNFAVQTLPPVDCRGPATAVMPRLQQTAAGVLDADRFLLTLGGEHSISAPLIIAAARRYPDLTVLHLDAHLDLRDRYEGDPGSHACVMRRVLEMGLPVVHVGIRSLCDEEHRLVCARRLPVFWGRDLTAPASGWVAQVLALLSARVYLSLDADVLDPSLMPATGTPEPGGLGWYDVLTLLREVFTRRQVVAADLVEAVPVAGMVLGEYTAARLAAKMLIYHQYAGLDSRPVAEARI